MLKENEKKWENGRKNEREGVVITSLAKGTCLR